MKDKFNSVINYVYIIEFAIQLYLWIGISEGSKYRTCLFFIGRIFELLLVIDICIHIYKKKDKKQLILKFILTLMPIIIKKLYDLLLYVIIGNRLNNTSQIMWGESSLIIVSSILFGIIIIWNSKVSGFFDLHWKSLVLCLYLLLWFFFGLIFYSIEYNTSGSFSYSDALLSEINYKDIISDEDYKLDEFQKDYVKAIFKDKDNKIEYLPINLSENNILLTDHKIGDNWAGYYYRNLIKDYNAFDILEYRELKLSSDCLNKESIRHGEDYLKYFNKKYILVKVRLYNSDSKNELRNNDNSECILYEKYIDDFMYKNTKKKDIYLIFETDNFDNYEITRLNLTYNIFANCLSESNTLIDTTVSDFNMKVRNGSNSVVNYLYYSAVVITTLGFGDMTPITLEIKVLTMIEALLGLIIMGFFLARAFEDIGKKSKGGF